jgi:sortase A
VLIGIFLGWHLVWNDLIQSERQHEAALILAQKWSLQDSTETSPTVPVLTPSNEEPPITTPPAEGEPFALLYVPRFGDDYARSIAEGVDLKTVLNSRSLGIGRYSQSDQLGEKGNFAVAAHRTTWGAPFDKIGELRIGDRIYVEVPEGWHSYLFRNLEYVWKSEVEVLNSFPKSSSDTSSARVITLTSCHPKFSEAERIIAYGVYEGWFPRESGPPPGIAELVQVGG